MKLAFNMERWRVSGGGCEISDQEAIAEGNSNIDMALKIFREVCIAVIVLFLISVLVILRITCIVEIPGLLTLPMQRLARI